MSRRLYRQSAAAWEALLNSLLPAGAPLLGEARNLIDRKTELFIESGAARLDEIIACYQQLESLKSEAEDAFPLSGDEISDLRAHIREKVVEAHSAEEAAVMALKAAIA